MKKFNSIPKSGIVLIAVVLACLVSFAQKSDDWMSLSLEDLMKLEINPLIQSINQKSGRKPS